MNLSKDLRLNKMEFSPMDEDYVLAGDDGLDILLKFRDEFAGAGWSRECDASINWILYTEALAGDE